MNRTSLAKNVDRYSIIRLVDGRVAVWERKGMLAITEWGKMGVKLSADTPLEVLLYPAQLAANYLKTITRPNQSKEEISNKLKTILDSLKVDEREDSFKGKPFAMTAVAGIEEAHAQLVALYDQVLVQKWATEKEVS